MTPFKNTAYRLLNQTLVRLSHRLSSVQFIDKTVDLLYFRLSSMRGLRALPFLELSQSTGSMEADWDKRARINAVIAATGRSDGDLVEADMEEGLRRIVLNKIPVEQSWVVLEIGCGIGALLKSVSHMASEVHGVDISGEMLKQAASRLAGRPNVILHKTNGALEMLEDGQFDLVYCSGVFIHFPRKDLVYAYFHEAARVLKDGGYFRFQVDGRAYLSWRAERASTNRGVVFAEEEIRNELADAGFEVQEVTGTDRLDMWVTAIWRLQTPENNQTV